MRRLPVEVRIGIKHSPRELAFETEATADEVRAALTQTAEGFATFADSKGKQIIVAADSVAFIEFGGESGRKVGFIG